jgi:hypothetical protein
VATTRESAPGSTDNDDHENSAESERGDEDDEEDMESAMDEDEDEQNEHSAMYVDEENGIPPKVGKRRKRTASAVDDMEHQVRIKRAGFRSQSGKHHAPPST